MYFLDITKMSFPLAGLMLGVTFLFIRFSEYRSTMKSGSIPNFFAYALK